MNATTPSAPSSRLDPPPTAIPAGHVGPVMLPGSDRWVWWTGRVAIGLRHERNRAGALSLSGEWVQKVMLRPPR